MSAYLSRNAVPPLTALSEDTLYGMQWFDEESGGGEEIWCRVLIRSILKDQNKAYVLCPDFGNSLLVSMSELKDLPREFYELPFQVRVYIVLKARHLRCSAYCMSIIHTHTLA